MDDDNWRSQPQGGGEQAMDGGDWRTQLPHDSRQRIVDWMNETLKRRLTSSGQEEPRDLKKIAVRFEEKIYSAATSQQDYLRKLSLKMLTIKAYVDSTAQTGNASVGDWQEEVYRKEMYLPELNEMYQTVSTKLQQQIIKFVNLYKPRNPDPTMQQTQSQTRKRGREGGPSTMPVVKAEASEELPLERRDGKYYEKGLFRLDKTMEDLNAAWIALLVEHDTLRAVIKKQDEELMLARAALEAKEKELQQVLAEQGRAKENG